MSLKAAGYVASWDAMPSHLRGLAFLLADYTSADTGLCCPSRATLARRSMTTERTVRRLISELEVIGVVRRHFRYVEGRQTTTQYELLPSPNEQNMSSREDTDVLLEEDASVPPEEDASVLQNQEVVTRKKGKEEANASVRVVFDYWRETMRHPRAVLDDKRRRAISARLKHYSVEDIKRAIDGCKASDWHQGNNPNGTKHDDIELICRDATRVEGFIAKLEGRLRSAGDESGTNWTKPKGWL